MSMRTNSSVLKSAAFAAVGVSILAGLSACEERPYSVPVRQAAGPAPKTTVLAGAPVRPTYVAPAYVPPAQPVYVSPPVVETTTTTVTTYTAPPPAYVAPPAYEPPPAYAPPPSQTYRPAPAYDTGGPMIVAMAPIPNPTGRGGRYYGPRPAPEPGHLPPPRLHRSYTVASATPRPAYVAPPKPAYVAPAKPAYVAPKPPAYAKAEPKPPMVAKPPVAPKAYAQVTPPKAPPAKPPVTTTTTTTVQKKVETTTAMAKADAAKAAAAAKVATAEAAAKAKMEAKKVADAAKVATAAAAMKVAEAAKPKPGAVKPAAPVVAKAEPAKPAPATGDRTAKLAALQSALTDAVSKSAVLTLPARFTANQPADVSLTLPAAFAETVRKEADKQTLSDAAASVNMTGVLAGEGFSVTPDDSQSQPLTVGQPTEFHWTVTAQPGAKGPLHADVGAVLLGGGQDTLSLGSVQKNAGMQLKMTPKMLGAGILALIVILVLGWLARGRNTPSRSGAARRAGRRARGAGFNRPLDMGGSSEPTTEVHH